MDERSTKALRTGEMLILLAVACGLATQLLLVRQATLLIHLTAAFPALISHVAGWGLGLMLLRRERPLPETCALLAAAAAAVAMLGLAATTSPRLALAGVGQTWLILPVALGSGVLSGLSVACALTLGRDPVRTLVADLCGVALGAGAHILMVSLAPTVPGPVPILALLVLAGCRTRASTSLVALALGLALLLPLDRPERLAQANTPLGRALREDPDAWVGAFHDLDGRVDALIDGKRGGMELFINGGTQAHTPLARPDRMLQAIQALARPASALVLGAGGLAEVAALVAHGADPVIAVERSRAVLRAARTVSPEAASLMRDARVRVLEAEARRFLERASERFDLVLLPLAYSIAGASPSALVFLPSHLFTVEGLAAQGRAASPEGWVCAVMPAEVLRDRLLASIGELERARRDARTPLHRRLWVATDPRSSGYSQAVCWSPHGSGEASFGPPDLGVLHHPTARPSPELQRRLQGRGTLAPVHDPRPYFFDVASGSGRLVGLPPSLRGLWLFSMAGALLLGLELWRAAAPRPSPQLGRTAIAVAGLTGAAFPALEHVLLSVARASGFSEGAAFAALALSFGVAGLAASLPRYSVASRAAAAALALLLLGAWLGNGGLTQLLGLERSIGLAAGACLLLVTMSFGLATFAGLFRQARRNTVGSGEVRHLFVASALGTLAGTAPVLWIELRMGAPASAYAAALLYGTALLVAKLSVTGGRSHPTSLSGPR